MYDADKQELVKVFYGYPAVGKFLNISPKRARVYTKCGKNIYRNTAGKNFILSLIELTAEDIINITYSATVVKLTASISSGRGTPVYVYSADPVRG